MSTTPQWLPVVLSCFGVFGTLAGVVVTQRRADRRERLAWDRERERERAHWTREDVARTFDHRREAYVDFYESLHAIDFEAYENAMGWGNLSPDWQMTVYRKLQRLRLYGSSGVAEKADAAFRALGELVRSTSHGEIVAPGSKWASYDAAFNAAERELLAAIRADLKVEPSPPERDTSRIS